MWLKNILLLIAFFTYSVSAGPKLKINSFDPDYPLGKNSFEEIPKIPAKYNELNFRLPNNTFPINYDISLITDIHIGNFNFFGTVIIHIRVIEATPTITVNSKQQTITNVDLLNANDVLIESNVDFEQTGVTEFLVIKPREDLLENNEYKVRISYRAVLRTDDYGFYRARYINEQGRLVWLATTQFQATEARHAFPCYDEPQIRSTYDISIRHHRTYRALSNMPVKSVTNSPIAGFLVTSFERIPSMQSYLVAFTVSDYIYVEDATVVPPQRIYGRAEPIHNHDYELAMFVSPQIMLTCENYYGINYTFPKMDQIAVTEFAAGAMENWGLVSYREPFLLFNPLFQTTRNEAFIIEIIAHEFVHQWIGNIVCPEWWTYLWINEGFATLYEYFIPHQTFPRQRLDDMFMVDVLQRVFEIDANPNIRHMSLYVEDPVSILSLFDWISYSKAGSVLHTLMFAIGENVFQQGVRNFLLDRFENFANPGHLYAAIQRSVNEYFDTASFDVDSIMRTWEFQAGFPLITVSKDNNDNIVLRQERFFYDQNEQSDSVWSIPINYATQSYPNFTTTTFDYWMTSRDFLLNKNSAVKTWNAEDWVIFNIQQKFYYRVNYDIELWNAIINQLNAGSAGYENINLRNRAQLIDDAFHLARSSRLSYGVIFGLMDHLWQETDYIPWVPTYRASVFLNRWLSGSAVYDYYQAFIRHNTEKIFDRLGVEFIPNELHLDRYARSIIVSMACEAQLDECLEQTNEELTAHVQTGKRIAPEYVSLIYCNGMRTANTVVFLMMKNRLFQANDTAERNRIIDGLGCSQNVDLLASFLNLAILPGIELTTTQKIRILTTSASNGEDSLIVLIRFTRASYESIGRISSTALSIVLENIARYVGSNSMFTEFENLLSHLVLNFIITPQQFIAYRDAARVNLIWQSQHLQDIGAFFENWEPRNPSHS